MKYTKLIVLINSLKLSLQTFSLLCVPHGRHPRILCRLTGVLDSASLSLKLTMVIWMRNVPYRLMCLSGPQSVLLFREAMTPLGGTLLVEEVTGVGFEGLQPPPNSCYLSFHFLCVDGNVMGQLPAVCSMPPFSWQILSLWNNKPEWALSSPRCFSSGCPVTATEKQQTDLLTLHQERLLWLEREPEIQSLNEATIEPIPENPWMRRDGPCVEKC